MNPEPITGQTPNPEASNFGASSEGRKKYQWQSGYPAEANSIIRFEAIVLFTYFSISLIALFLTWTGTIETLLSNFGDIRNSDTIKRYGYFVFSGLMAGSIYSIKWLYHAVGKGFWHEDRQLWRFMTPLMSLGVAFIVGTLIDANLISSDDQNPSAPTSISIGFIAGYFSDAAIAKMYEIANVIFGTGKTSTENAEADKNQASKSEPNSPTPPNK